jgi:hypothetical protein
MRDGGRAWRVSPGSARREYYVRCGELIETMALSLNEVRFEGEDSSQPALSVVTDAWVGPFLESHPGARKALRVLGEAR